MNNMTASSSRVRAYHLEQYVHPPTLSTALNNSFLLQDLKPRTFAIQSGMDSGMINTAKRIEVLLFRIKKYLTFGFRAEIKDSFSLSHEVFFQVWHQSRPTRTFLRQFDERFF